MARFLRMFRKKALQVALEPERSSCHFPQKQSGSSVPPARKQVLARPGGTPRDSEDKEKEECVDVATEEAALKNIQEQLQDREKALHKVIPELLDAMLGNLLAEFPGTDRPQYILEVFGNIVSEEQRRSFLQTATLAIYDPLLWIIQAGLVLAYFILGEADQLLGDEVNTWIRFNDPWPFASRPGKVIPFYCHLEQQAWREMRVRVDAIGRGD
ncbi:unnamed protein product [Caretta caretta]